MAGKDFPESTAADRAFITNEEGKIPYIYDDAKYPTRKYVKGTKIVGNLTGGVGHLISRHSTIVDPAAYNAFLGKTIPANVMDQWLDDDLDDAERVVARTLKVDLPKGYNRGALYSLAFNIGAGAYAGSGLVKKINDKNWNAIPGEFNKWVKTTIVKNGAKVRVTSSGLQKRRAHETAYFLGGVAPKLMPTVKIEPKSTEIAEPMKKKWTPEEIVGAGTTVATVTAGGFTTTGFLSYVFGGILIVAVLAIGVIFIKRQFFPH